MSISRQQTHSSTRDTVLIAHASDMLSRTSMSKEDFAENLSRALYSAAPDKSHAKDVPDLEAMTRTADHSTYARASGAWLKRVQRWLDGSVELPAWMEEAWVQAMLPEWRERCLVELSARYGLLAVRPIAADHGEAIQVFAGISKAFGQLAGVGGEVFADGLFNHLDASNAGDMETHCRSLAAFCVAMADKAAQVKAVH